MSNLKYSDYPGAGQWFRENNGLSQAVRIGDRIEASGQGTFTISMILEVHNTNDLKKGGWDPNFKGVSFPKDLKQEIDQAFANVDLNLKHAGGKGWDQVFRVNSYHTDLTDEVSAWMVENFRKWMPNHQPIWTEVGVKQLGAPEMHVEIEVVAYVG